MVACGELPTSLCATAPVKEGCCTYTPGKSLVIEPVSVLASRWKTELAGRVTLIDPVLVINWYDPVWLIEPLNVIDPVFEFKVEPELKTPSLTSIEPVLLRNDIRPLMPLTSRLPVVVLSSSAALLGAVTSKSTLSELKKMTFVVLSTFTVTVLAALF